MFQLKHLITAFLVPPGVFVLLFLLSGFVSARRKRWRACILFMAAGGALWAVSVSPVSDALMRGLEEGFETRGAPEGDVIVLLGGGVASGATDLSGTGAPSDEMMGRIVTAARLQKRLSVPIIVSGGKAFRHFSAEAPIVGRVLADLGVPRDKVILEEKSRDTFENAKFSAEICASLGYGRPVVVTSAFHLRRAVMLFRRAGVSVTPCPANARTWRGKIYGWQDYLPGAGPLRDASVALKERLGLLYYRIA